MIIWRTKETTKKTPKENRNYDVKITFEKSGKNTDGTQRFVVTFRFYNNAKQQLKNFSHIVVSSITSEKCDPTKIYFKGFAKEEAERLRNEENYTLYKLTQLSTTCSFGMAPKEDEEKLYRLGWTGRKFNIRLDADNECFYICKGEEITDSQEATK